MIIGIGYRKCVGKDTIAKEIVKVLDLAGEKAKIVSISDTLFDMANLAFDWAGVKNATYYNKNYLEKDKQLPAIPGNTPRSIAKALGDVVRKVSENALMEKIIFEAQDSIVIVPNIRFPNEANIVKLSKGILVNVVRPSVPVDTGDPFDNALNDWKDWDEVIVNDGPKEELIGKAAAFVSRNRKSLVKNGSLIPGLG